VVAVDVLIAIAELLEESGRALDVREEEGDGSPRKSVQRQLVGWEEAEALLSGDSRLVVLVVGGLGRFLRLEQIVGKLGHRASLAG
jgi:hypothetical protein